MMSRAGMSRQELAGNTFTPPVAHNAPAPYRMMKVLPSLTHIDFF